MVMETDQQKSSSGKSNSESFSEAQSGNASNPSPQDDRTEPTSNQLLDEKADKYLREVASIEDMPDAQDQQDMDDTIHKNSTEE